MTTTRIAVLVALAACGGTPGAGSSLDTAREQQPHAASPHAADDEHAAFAKLPPAVAQFHDVLAPRWHAAQGPERMTDTCAAVGQLRDGAQAIAAADLPAGSDAATWHQATSELTTAVTALDGTCKVRDADAFEPAFARVHTGFHRVMDAGPK